MEKVQNVAWGDGYKQGQADLKKKLMFLAGDYKIISDIAHSKGYEVFSDKVAFADIIRAAIAKAEEIK